MNEVFQNTWQWIHEDFRSNRFRFVVEVTAWSISIGCAITMALTVPTPPSTHFIFYLDPWLQYVCLGFLDS
jgi:hypothetical protein